jgi:hypothetical protein
VCGSLSGDAEGVEIAAVEDVVTGSTAEQVVAAQTAQGVVTGPTEQHIRAGSAGEGVVPGADRRWPYADRHTRRATQATALWMQTAAKVTSITAVCIQNAGPAGARAG